MIFYRVGTLYINETPRENGCPLKIVIGEAFPPTEQTYGEIGEHRQTRPYGPLTVVRFLVGRQQPHTCLHSKIISYCYVYK